MKTIAVLCLALLAANSVFADIYSSAINQAKNVAAGKTPGGAPIQQQPQQQAPPLMAPSPQLEATLKNVADLKLDLDKLATLTPTNSGMEVKESLMTNLFIAAQGLKPSEASVSRLVDHLTEAMAGRGNMIDQHTKLAQDLHALFNGSHLTAAQSEVLLANVQTIFQTGGVTTDVALNVVNDLKAVTAETSEATQ
ncbi:MAG TPA: hypothetical protein VFV23_09515 [Verrucomicrobiae bacterium]|nr:hypothetical protein [Verrucomicrobiae bacterium]